MLDLQARMLSRSTLSSSLLNGESTMAAMLWGARGLSGVLCECGELPGACVWCVLPGSYRVCEPVPHSWEAVYMHMHGAASTPGAETGT